MDIEEINKLKKELDDAISLLLSDFGEKTSLWVEDIEVGYADVFAPRGKKGVYILRTVVRL